MRRLTRRHRGILIVLAAVLVVGGAVALVVGIRAQRQAPQPPPAAAGSYAPSSRSSVPAPSAPSSPSATNRPIVPTTHGPILTASRPVRLQIPKIGVDDSLLLLGINRDRTIQVPPLSAHSQPGWYKYSPTPGALGPAVILGHVDSAKYGAGVFFELGALRKGDTVDVTLADHTVAVFRIDGVASYPKDHFPTLTVYGNTDHAALRLITCGGSFDSSTGNYRNNIVAFASLVSSHRAS